MCKPSQYINDICPSCHPRDCVKTLAEFMGEVKVVTNINDDGSKEFENEYVYACIKCGARMWVDEQWVKGNSVEADERGRHNVTHD